MNTREDILKNEGRSADRSVVLPPSLNLTKYRDLMDDPSLPAAQLDEMLGIVASICASFVEWGLDVKNIPAFLPEILGNPSEVATGAISSGDEEGDNDTA